MTPPHQTAKLRFGSDSPMTIEVLLKTHHSPSFFLCTILIQLLRNVTKSQNCLAIEFMSYDQILKIEADEKNLRKPRN